MRYKVKVVGREENSPRRQGFAIWDKKLSPFAVEECTTPVYCSLDGKEELIFPRMTEAFLWLARCERAGLDLEAVAGDLFTVYTSSAGRGVELLVKYTGGPGPTGRELPAVWREDYE